MAETNAEDRFFAHQPAHSFVRIRERCRIARPVGKENSVGVERERFIGARRGRHDGDAKSILSQPPENIFLHAVIVGHDMKSRGWQRLLRRSARVSVRDRPKLAQPIVWIPFVNRRRGDFTHVIHPNDPFAFNCALRRLSGRDFVSR